MSRRAIEIPRTMDNEPLQAQEAPAVLPAPAQEDVNSATVAQSQDKTESQTAQE